MYKKFVKTFIFFFSAVIGLSVGAQELPKDLLKTPITNFNKENLDLIKNNDFTKDILKVITYNQDDVQLSKKDVAMLDFEVVYKNANEKFAQGNITSAYKDYKEVIA